MKTTISIVLSTVLPFVVGFLVILEIISINRFAGRGKNLAEINNGITSLLHENSLLEEKIASYSSLAAVSRRAQEMGFVDTTTSSYQTMIPAQLPVAIKSP